MVPPFPDGMARAVFGLGCFWGAERYYWQVPGVFTTAVGYAGGITPNPSYEEVCSGRTGHTEVVLVVFDPLEVSYGDLLKVFWETHDPTQGMRQGNDVGSQYRSAIYTFGDEQQALAEQSGIQYEKSLAAAGFTRITTEIALVGTESLDVQGASYKCQVQQYEMGGTKVKAWVVEEGDYAGKVALKSEVTTMAGDATTTVTSIVTELSKEKVKIGSQEVECVVVMMETESGVGITRTKFWWSDKVPGRQVKMEQKTEAGLLLWEATGFGSSAFDFPPPFPGKDDKKPEPEPEPEPMPEPKPEPKDPTADEIAKKGEVEILAAVPLFKAVAKAVNGLPDDKDELKNLLDMAKEARKHLTQAQAHFLDAKDKHSDPDSLQKKIDKIDGLIKKIDRYSLKISSKLQ